MDRNNFAVRCKKTVAGTLCAALILLSPGARSYELWAQSAVSGAAQAVPAGQALPVQQIAAAGIPSGPAIFLPRNALPFLLTLPVSNELQPLAGSGVGVSVDVPKMEIFPDKQEASGAVNGKTLYSRHPGLDPGSRLLLGPGFRRDDGVVDASRDDEVGRKDEASKGVVRLFVRGAGRLWKALRGPSSFLDQAADGGIEASQQAAAEDFTRRLGGQGELGQAGGLEIQTPGEGRGAVGRRHPGLDPGSSLILDSGFRRNDEQGAVVSRDDGVVDVDRDDGVVGAGRTSGQVPALAARKSAQQEIRYRRVLFPAVLAALSAAVFITAAAVFFGSGWVLAHAALIHSPWLVEALAAFAEPLRVTMAAAGVMGAVFSGWALYDLAVFSWAVFFRADISDREFWDFAKAQLLEMGLHPSVISGLLGYAPGRGILRIYRPQRGRFSGFAFGVSQGDAIYLRPELARAPGLFQAVLKHEMGHYLQNGRREPLARRSKGLGGFFRGLSDEALARAGEWHSRQWLKSLRIPVLERVLKEAQVSLRLGAPYPVLIVEPSSSELLNPSAYDVLSEGRARVRGLYTGLPEKGLVVADPADMTGFASRENARVEPSELKRLLQAPEHAGRYRVIVLPNVHLSLPLEDSAENRRLEQALRSIDEAYRLEQRNRSSSREGFKSGGPLALRLKTLGDNIGVHVGGNGSVEGVSAALNKMMNEFSGTQLQDVGLADYLQALYAGLQDHGIVLLPFHSSDPGVALVERVFRFWTSSDNGEFQVQRVDLAEGGHVIVARKMEPRLNLWLTPAKGVSLPHSQLNLDTDPSAPAQDDLLRSFGFNDQERARFVQAGLRVRHVFGRDVGDNRIYVSVLKAYSKVLKRLSGARGVRFGASRGGYRVQLLESGIIQDVVPVWKLRIRGEGGRIYDIDTGLDVTHPDFADRILQCIDFVGEGPEDWSGHGTHKAGISYANGPLYKGMAPAAEGRMGKVFSQAGQGASDGDIMAAAVDAMKWGSDVVSVSLGSPGDSDAPLAEFFSHLLEQKSASGEPLIGTGSSGNAGPFNKTLSQPANARNMIDVGAAAKSLDDGVPETAFYSSVGPALDGRFKRYGLTRWVLKPDITALGGDVTTLPGNKDVYSQGITSVRSKDMPPGPSNTEDGLHTRMAGSSMANPQVAAIALLVKQAVRKVIGAGSAAYEYFRDQLSFCVKMLLMRSAVDMRVPVFFQGAGFVDALAAVKLAAETFGPAPGVSRFKLFRVLAAAAGLAAASPVPSWAWIDRAAQVQRLEDRVFNGAAEVGRQNAARSRDARAEGASEEPSEDDDEAVPEAVSAQDEQSVQARFAQLRAQAAPELRQALKDEVWVVRFYAAFTLMNLKAPEAVLDLAAAALSDEDGRVRQTAFLALAEIPHYGADELLRKACGDERPDVGLYAAYALARHGDVSGLPRIRAEMTNPDKKTRFTAVWLAGQLGGRASPEVVEALAGRVADASERGNIRHLAAASLTELANLNQALITDGAVCALLAAAGPGNLALTRTISKFFRTANRSAAFKTRLKKPPLRESAAGFVQAHKAAAGRPGALGELVSTLAKILDIPLDLPTPVQDRGGAGVAGVDPNLGPLHLILELPRANTKEGLLAPRVERFQDLRGGAKSAALSAAAGYGLEPAVMERFEADLQAAFPNAQALWVNVPDTQVLAFTAELESKGWRVHKARPVYPLLNETGPLSGIPEIRAASGLTGRGVLVAYLDEGADLSHPALAGDRIKGKRNFTAPGNAVDGEALGHGTYGMGIVGGRSVEGSPYEGMAPDVDFAVGKVLSADGGTDAMVMAGLEWAASLVQDPLKTPMIVNLSLGGQGRADSPFARLVDALRLKNITVIAAAGNEGPSPGSLDVPAKAELAIRVGAVDKSGALAFYSARGSADSAALSWVDYGGAVAFGMPNPYEIASAFASKLAQQAKDAPTTVLWQGKPLYRTFSGTSVAAEHTTGKFALLIEKMAAVLREKADGLPDGYSFYLESLIARTAAPLAGQGLLEAGAGLIDEKRALAALEEELKEPERVIAQSRDMMSRARERYGFFAARSADLPPARGWRQAVRDVFKRWVMGAAGLFLFPTR
ncbi:MAG: S8 family serine peptidase [Elusimicrobiota bacterium]